MFTKNRRQPEIKWEKTDKEKWERKYDSKKK